MKKTFYRRIVFGVIFLGGYCVGVPMTQGAVQSCNAYGQSVAREYSSPETFPIIYSDGNTCPFYSFQQYVPFVPTSSGTHCCMTAAQANIALSDAGLPPSSLPTPLSYTGPSGLPTGSSGSGSTGGSSGSTATNYVNDCVNRDHGTVRPRTPGCNSNENELWSFMDSNGGGACCLAQSVAASTLLTQAQCEAKRPGAYCGARLGGNGCGGSDAPVGTCTGSGILFGNETCCLDYDAVCTGEYKGRVTAARWGCYNTENTVFDFGTSRCCVEKTQAELDAAAASGGVSSGGGPSTTGGAQGTGSSAGSTQAGNGSSTGAPLTKPLAANGTCASPNACRSTKCNTGETTASGSCPNSGVCCAPAGGTTPPAGGAAAGGAAAGGTITVQIKNPLQYDTVEGILGQVMSTLRNIVVILALVFLVIGGLMYITSAGNDKRISAAKACITAALVGIAIVMVAPSFLKEIGSVLGWSEASSMAAPTLSEIARKVLNFLLGIVGVIAIIMFLVGSVMYLTSAGDDKRAGTAKDIVKYAIIGLIVAFSALVLVAQLASFFV